MAIKKRFRKGYDACESVFYMHISKNKVQISFYYEGLMYSRFFPV